MSKLKAVETRGVEGPNREPSPRCTDRVCCQSLATVVLANSDARVRFYTHAARGNPKPVLGLLDTLERPG